MFLSLEDEVINILYKAKDLGSRVKSLGSVEFRVSSPLGRRDKRGEGIEVGCFCSFTTFISDSVSM